MLERKGRHAVEINTVSSAVDRFRTIHRLFERQAERSPEQTAIVLGERHLSYREFNEMANRLARALIARQVRPGTVVAILLDRSIELVVSIMAVLKAGGCYLPLDPEYPTDRLEYMLEDSQASLLITSAAVGESLNFKGEIIDPDNASVWNHPKNNPDISLMETDLAYLIYTSGTTGRPKGVMLEHKGIVNLKSFWEENLEICQRDKIGLFASISFDASVWEIFMALLNGAVLHVLSKELVRNMKEFQSYLASRLITVMTLPPSYATYLDPSQLPELRLLITAGSATSRELVNKWCDKVSYINAYGPTETSICATVWTAPRDGFEGNHIPIGLPIKNTQIYILDEDNKPSAQGQLGELCIGGVGLARGYLNRTELTTEKFVDNPVYPGEKLYRTGDYALWLPDGNVEYHGRIDHQVKISGHRIEPGEIEAALLRHSQITEAAVLAHKDFQGEFYLCAHYVAETELSVEELRRRMEEDLPRYMIPVFFQWLKQMPLTINGKVNRDKLLPPERIAPLAGEYAAPRNSLERLLAEIWQEVLGIDRISVHDNFYTLGGDSIKAIRIVSKLFEHQLRLTMTVLMKHPTISASAARLFDMEHEHDQGIVQGEVKLSPVQHWFFSKQFTAMHHWNQSVLLYHPEGYDKDILQAALMKCLKHHDALRMSFSLDRHPPMQINRDTDLDGLLGFTVFHVPPEADSKQFVYREMLCLQSSIQLSQGPLITVGLFHTTQGDHIFLAVHHLVCDGVSMRILVEDLSRAYEQAERGKEVLLPKKTDSYQAWTQALYDYSVSRKLLEEIPYWKELQLKRFLPLPKDMHTALHQQKHKQVVKLELPQTETAQLLKTVHRAYHTDMNDILLAALGITLRQWTGYDTLVLHLEGHGREELNNGLHVSRTVGWFTSQYPVWLDLADADDLPRYLKKTMENLRGIPGKGIGYEILKYLTPENERQGLVFTLEPEICFNYLGQLDNEINQGKFTPSPFSDGSSLGPDGLGNLGQENEIYFPLIFTGYIQFGRLHFQIAYNSLEYNETTIDELAERFIRHLRKIIEHCIRQEQSEKTPRDFSCSRLKQKDVEQVYARLGQVLK